MMRKNTVSPYYLFLEQKIKGFCILFSILGIVACSSGGGDDKDDDPSNGTNDTTAPVITILGSQSITIEVGGVYTDEGATATDDISGDLTAVIATTSTVNSAAVGSYLVTYTVSDEATNESTSTRTVVVEDTVSPVIVVLGDNPTTVELGIDYSDAGATASDIGEGNLSAEIESTGTVDTSQIGFYTITYSVSDSSGNTATETRSVEVSNTLPTSLNQAAFNISSGAYEYAHNSIPNIMISDAPADTDRSRSAMLHDNVVNGDAGEFRLYFFKKGSNDTFYQFAYNPNTGTYQWGYESIATLKVTGMPSDADSSSFAMLHDGTTYRLYMQSKTTNSIHQAAFNPTSNDYEYGLNSISQINLTGGPIDTDYSRWAMLHDGSAYRFYAFKAGSTTNFYQFGFNTSTLDYEYGHLSIPELTVVDMPSTSDRNDFSMLHDGSDYRFYFLNND